MKEILFRGKQFDSDEWIEGQLLYFKSNVSMDELTIIVKSCEWDNLQEWLNLGKRARVEPKTVGQYTGLTDIDGKKIFEGDIIELLSNTYRVYWDKSEACYQLANSDYSFYKCASRSKVIGNIYDNPELLGVKNDRD